MGPGLLDGTIGVRRDGQGLPGRRDAPPHVHRAVFVPGALIGHERVQMRGHIDYGRLLETTGEAAEDGHLLDHDDVAGEHVVRAEGERAGVTLELVKLRDLVAVGIPESSREVL
jgi:hypothetical protein